VTLSTEVIWEEMKRLFHVHGQVIIAFAGVFMFLPGLASIFFLDEPNLDGKSLDVIAANVNAWMRANWLPLMAQALVSAFGAAMIYRYILSKTPVTAQGAIIQALPLMPAFILTNLITTFGILVGLYLFVLPGVYLIGRVLLVSPIVAAEGRIDAWTAFQRSTRLTRGSGWRLAGMLFLLVFVTFLITFMVGVVISLFARALMPDHAASLVRAALSTLQMTIINLAGILMAAASYRLLSDAADHHSSKGI
jgi:Membrane domain of glycerophosphoryl diester phosphodiesterase